MEKRPGISGLTGAFKESVSRLPEGSKVVFAGSAAVCSPFAELLAYAVKDRNFELVFLPRANASDARIMRWSEGVGYSVTGEMGDPSNPGAIVLLGGLAMPKFGCPLAYVQETVKGLSTKDTRVVGVCFMGIFEREGWTKAIPFDSLINAIMEATLIERQGP